MPSLGGDGDPGGFPARLRAARPSELRVGRADARFLAPRTPVSPLPPLTSPIGTGGVPLPLPLPNSGRSRSMAAPQSARGGIEDYLSPREIAFGQLNGNAAGFTSLGEDVFFFFFFFLLLFVYLVAHLFLIIYLVAHLFLIIYLVAHPPACFMN
jgi:hypothetical protein